MTIDIEYDYPDIFIKNYREIIEKVIFTTLDYEDCPYEAMVYVLLTDNESIRTINREHRGLDRPTDVLSFPMHDYPVPADFSRIEETDPDAFHPDSGELMLGDILISMDKVLEQSEAYGHSATREMAFLTAHSMLHLMGYDHMEDEERKVMEAKQEEILNLCGYRR